MTAQFPTMTPQDFVARWSNAGFGERQGAQPFFIDLCAVVGHPTPAAYGDPERFTLEKWVPGGFADAYFEEHFGWEFKGRDTQLDGAFDQLLRYQVHLKTPPLLIVSSFQTIRIQTNFPGMETGRYDLDIEELTQSERLDILRDVFIAPHRFRERLRSVDAVTRETASLFQSIVVDMEERNEDPERLARYLNQLVFCLYSEDAGLLPDGLFSRIVRQHHRDPATFDRAIRSLFAQMATGGFAGADEIAHFNGDLFNVVDTVELSTVALQRLGEACERNWRDIEPSIFGTLFERALDASKRAQTGAHYTGADDIKLVVEPVVMTPLRREWEETKASVDELLDAEHGSNVVLAATEAIIRQTQRGQMAELTVPDPPNVLANAPRIRARQLLDEFQDRLTSVQVLDPACGSGNFLYIALRSLLDLELEVIDFAAVREWHGLTPKVQTNQMLGLEINHYAAELARTALWIGYIQWHQSNGFPYTQRPILTPLDTIRQTDAILDLSDPENPVEPEWPAAEFIVGNPPFLGHVPFRETLGDDYVGAVYGLYGDRIPNFSDLCCYWFEKARAQIELGASKRAGLLATQTIRSQSSRPVLARIKQTGDIFEAISDSEWVLEGAAVHISIICFDDGAETNRSLDGSPVSKINGDLTAGTDLTQARKLAANAGMAFQGVSKVGDFDISEPVALGMMAQPNPHGRSNADVIRPWIAGIDITQRPRHMWAIDFGTGVPEYEAALYEAPFEYLASNVKPQRMRNNRRRYADLWWLHAEARPGMRKAIAPLSRYIGTPKVAKHRFFVWLQADMLASNLVIAIASDDDYVFGVLQSVIHTTWALAIGSQLEDRPTYTPTTCFETFPFPIPTKEQRAAIGAAAEDLNRLREGWLNPEGVSAAELRRRTLTNLYNDRPTWLENIHARLDAATAGAYGWPADLSDVAILERLLMLNLERAEAEPNSG